MLECRTKKGRCAVIPWQEGGCKFWYGAIWMRYTFTYVCSYGRDEVAKEAENCMWTRRLTKYDMGTRSIVHYDMGTRRAKTVKQRG